MFLLNNGKSGVKFYKRTAAELVTLLSTDKNTAVLLANLKQMGTLKSIMFKNTIGQTLMVAFAKAPSMNPDKSSGPDYFMTGAVFDAAGTITLSHATVGSPDVIGNSSWNWRVGTTFRLRGTTSNDNKTFVVASVVGNVITVNTFLGSTPVNETVAPNTPALIQQFSLIDGFEIVDGDSISLDMFMNTIDVTGETGSTEIFVYPIGALTSNANNAIRLYGFSG